MLCPFRHWEGVKDTITRQIASMVGIIDILANKHTTSRDANLRRLICDCTWIVKLDCRIAFATTSDADFGMQFMLSINSGQHIYRNREREQSPYWGFWLLSCDVSFCSLPGAFVLS